MRSRLVLLVVSAAAVLASIAVTVQGYAAKAPTAPADDSYVFLPVVAKRYLELPPPLEVSAVGWLRERPPLPSACNWGSHYVQDDEGEIVAWVDTLEGFSISWEGYLNQYVRVRGVAGPRIADCPTYIYATTVKFEESGQPTVTPGPSPTPPE